MQGKQLVAHSRDCIHYLNALQIFVICLIFSSFINYRNSMYTTVISKSEANYLETTASNYNILHNQKVILANKTQHPHINRHTKKKQLSKIQKFYKLFDRVLPHLESGANILEYMGKTVKNVCGLLKTIGKYRKHL